MRIGFLSIPLAILMAACVAHPAYGATYNLQSLGTLGGNSSVAQAVSSNGLVVGASTTATGASHAFLWQNGIMQDLGTLGGDTSAAFGVNSAGQVVGWSTPKKGAARAFLWHDGVMEDLGAFSSEETEALDINENGQIVGYSVVLTPFPLSFRPHIALWQSGTLQDLGTAGSLGAGANSINSAGDMACWYYSGGDYRSFLLRGGVVTDLGTLSNKNGECDANDINDSDWIVGRAKGQYDSHPFLWRNGTMEDLGSLGGSAGEAGAVNNAGVAVGWSTLQDSTEQAFVWSNGLMQNLGVPQSESRAFGVNDNGWIVGISGSTAALWTPVPEPSCMVVVGGALTGLVWRKRSKR